MSNRASGITKYTETTGKHKAFRNATYKWLKKHGKPATGQEIIEAFSSGQILARSGMPFTMKYVPSRPNDVSQRLRRDARFIKGMTRGGQWPSGGSYDILTWTVEE